MAEEVAPGIFLVRQKKRTRLAAFSVNVYVIAGKDGLVFDAGMGDKKSGDALVKEIRAIEEIVRKRGEECTITRILPSHGHWDHFSGVEHLRKKLGLKVLSTPKMKPNLSSRRLYKQNFRKEVRMTEPQDSALKRWFKKGVRAVMLEFFIFAYGVVFVKEPMEMVHEGDTLTIGEDTWDILGAPGHCDDDIVLFNRSRGILLCGDIVLRSIFTWIGPPRSDLDLYIRALEILKSLPGLTLILPAHGSPITDPYVRLDEAIDHRHKRTDGLIDLIKKTGERGIDFDRIMDDIYPGQNMRERYISKGWVYLTLQSLIEKKQVETSVHKGRIRFYIPGSEI